MRHGRATQRRPLGTQQGTLPDVGPESRSASASSRRSDTVANDHRGWKRGRSRGNRSRLHSSKGGAIRAGAVVHDVSMWKVSHRLGVQFRIRRPLFSAFKGRISAYSAYSRLLRVGYLPFPNLRGDSVVGGNRDTHLVHNFKNPMPVPIPDLTATQSDPVHEIVSKRLNNLPDVAGAYKPRPLPSCRQAPVASRLC